MCLATVDEKTSQYTEGYKVYSEIKGILYNTCYDCDKKQYRRRWLKNEVKKMISSDRGKSYQAGYHFFPKLEDAKVFASYKNDIIYKIKVRNVTNSGIQHYAGASLKVGVAQEVLIDKFIYKKEDY